MPRKKQEPVQAEVARAIGGLLRGLRRAAGYRAVRDAASVPGCPAAQQTIYAYERGGLVPSLKQFMDLVEFYALRDGASEEVRYRGVAALVAALASPAYHLPDAWNLISRLQPAPAAGRRRAGSRTGRVARKTTRTAAKGTRTAAKGTRTAAKGTRRVAAKGTRVAPARSRRAANARRTGRASRVTGPTRRTAGRATGGTLGTEQRATGVRRPAPESRRR